MLAIKSNIDEIGPSQNSLNPTCRKLTVKQKMTRYFSADMVFSHRKNSKMTTLRLYQVKVLFGATSSQIIIQL